MMIHKRFGFLMIACVLSLGGCQTAGNKEILGTAAGGALGGYLGSKIGSGDGQLAAVAGGTLLGALLGQNIGASLDELDRMKMSQAVTKAQDAPLKQPIRWNNPDSGNSGMVTALRDGQAENGDYCREFQQTVNVSGRTEQTLGTACRDKNGYWQVIN